MVPGGHDRREGRSPADVGRRNSAFLPTLPGGLTLPFAAYGVGCRSDHEVGTDKNVVPHKFGILLGGEDSGNVRRVGVTFVW